jgi:hypothetical protein
MADFSRPFILQTDASSLALAAVLLQEFEGERQPKAFSSRTLCYQERKFSAYELECLGVLLVWRNFGPIWNMSNSILKPKIRLLCGAFLTQVSLVG